MRLPVSRARYDLLEHNSRELIAQLKAALAIADAQTAMWETNAGGWRHSYDDLMEKYHALRFQRIEGTNAVVATEAVAAPLPFEIAHDELKALIAEVSGTDLRKRAMMLRALAADRAAHVPEDEIRTAILNGVQSDGVPA